MKKRLTVLLVTICLVFSSFVVSADALSTSGFVKPYDDQTYDYVVTRANDAYYQTPEWVRRTFEDADWEMYVLEDTGKYGYDICAGLTVYDEHRIYIANIADAATVKTVEHELGHFLDDYFAEGTHYSFYTSNPEFVYIYEEEYPAFRAEYRYTHGDDNVREYWAEACYYYWTDPVELQALVPKTFEYINDILYDYSGEYPYENTVANTTVNGESGWWYFVNHEPQINYTGICNYSNPYGWWYVRNGKVDFSYNGVASNEYGTWYVKDGKVDFSFNGLSNYADSNGNWWTFKAGKAVQNVNDIVQNNFGWWYVENGKVNFNYTGVGNFSNQYGWWYIKNGQVDFSRNSVEQNQYGWWYVLSGQVWFDYTGISNYANDYGWWYINQGKVDFSNNSVEPNNYGWWKVSNGKVDFSFTGLAGNQYGNWYINNGKVNFGFNGVINSQRVINGKVV